ncbi:PREDICTED: uncharacterized protein LOC109190194 isoform X2 [Ipomoea nil]|uniref:uncharacterized protein LOC109190194 isoform X2 n=1 Tax=Ipomoea nil TaxID=35883 RepID=UPI0009016CD8|nr:PREDICTED: uncharacterized protein LOC109190194 isoform X2 [Ipomoea nil]
MSEASCKFLHLKIFKDIFRSQIIEHVSYLYKFVDNFQTHQTGLTQSSGPFVLAREFAVGMIARLEMTIQDCIKMSIQLYNYGELQSVWKRWMGRINQKGL